MSIKARKGGSEAFRKRGQTSAAWAIAPDANDP